MMFGGRPGPSTAVGGLHCVSTGALGGVIRTAEMFWAIEVLDVDRDVPGSLPASRPLEGGAMVTGAPAGRVTAIWTAVVVPTKTGSVPRGPPPLCVVGVGFHGVGLIPGPQLPSGVWPASARRGAGQIRAGQRDHGKGVAWLTSPDRLPTSETGQ